MKTIFLLFSVMLLTAPGYSQRKINHPGNAVAAPALAPGDTANGIIETGTTETEYNYLVKGYRAQLENGLDNKAGYNFKDEKTVRVNGIEFVFSKLYNSEGLRGVLCIFVDGYGVKQFVCFPVGNSKLESSFISQLNGFTTSLRPLFAAYVNYSYLTGIEK